ncbi:MAG: ABC transporter ATP-binding protein [Spirochaetales bacterium]|nr:ABC transporter ATP-binding protein [Spirochaetales bacterium]
MFKKFISYYKPYKGLFFLDIFVAMFSSSLSILLPMITRQLLGEFIPSLMWRQIIWCFIIIFAIYCTNYLCDFIRLKWGHFLGAMMEADIRRDLFTHIQKLSFHYFDHIKTGHMMSRMTNDLFQITETAHHCPEDLIISITTIVLSLIVMLSYSPWLTLATVLPLPFLVLYGVVFARRLKQKYKAVKVKIADLNSNVENSLQGIKEIKAFAKENYQQGQFNTVNDKVLDTKKAQYSYMAKSHSTMTFLRNLCYFSTVTGGVILIALNLVPTYDLITFLLFVSIILPPIDRLINFTEQFQEGMASFERFCEIMEIEPEIVDLPNAKPLQISEGKVEYKAVHFSYDENGTEVIGDLNLTIQGGAKVALVGESGAGKTTIATLLPRFYVPQAGAILIDGQDISCVTQKSLHEQIGFVQQNVFLFDASIRENLKYGRINATDEEMLEALKAANLYEFISSLPQGLDTQVGERGTRLSGGQKQRLSIARVFLKNPKILIFDEATSSLDNESEALIVEAFNRLAKGRTSIVIAHRLSTIVSADKIFVVDKGKVVEQGSPVELLQAKGVYAKLYNIQA